MSARKKDGVYTVMAGRRSVSLHLTEEEARVLAGCLVTGGVLLEGKVSTVEPPLSEPVRAAVARASGAVGTIRERLLKALSEGPQRKATLVRVAGVSPQSVHVTLVRMRTRGEVVNKEHGVWAIP